MPEQALLLLGERRLQRNRFAAKSGGRLLKEPGTAERGAGDHDAIDVVAAKGLDHFCGGVEVAIADERNAFEMLLDFGDAVPVGPAFEKVGGDAAVNCKSGCAGGFDGLSNFKGGDLIARAAEADFGS